MTKISQADAYEIVAGSPSTRLILLCDHASSRVPAEYGDLGLPAAQFARHIAYDIGARDLTLGLAERLAAPAVLSRFSRLLIDPNRGLDDPTLIMRISDGAAVPGNREMDEAERQRRIERFHAPYHRAVEGDTLNTHGTRPGLPHALIEVRQDLVATKTGVDEWVDRVARVIEPIMNAG